MSICPLILDAESGGKMRPGCLDVRCCWGCVAPGWTRMRLRERERDESAPARRWSKTAKTPRILFWSLASVVVGLRMPASHFMSSVSRRYCAEPSEGQLDACLRSVPGRTAVTRP